MNALVFASKIDWWLGIVLWSFAILMLLLPLWEWKYNLERSIPSKIFVSVICWSSALFIPFIILTLEYRLTDQQLVVETGFGKTKIAIADITKITPTHNSISAPALSLDRLDVQYFAGERNKQNNVLISPNDKALFLEAIQQRDPSLKFDHSGSALIKVSGD